MSREFEGDPLDALRRVDPIDPRDVPPDTSGQHARTLFQEITSTETMDRAIPVPAPRRRPPRLVAALGAAVVIVAVVGVAVTRDGDPGTESIVGGVPIASATMCVEEYSPDTLADRSFAFDGTVASIDGDEVAFDVNVWFRGGSDAGVTLLAGAGMVEDGITSISGNGAVLEVGSRYLVAGTDQFVWGCGFTMTYDTAIARQWADVFGS